MATPSVFEYFWHWRLAKSSRYALGCSCLLLPLVAVIAGIEAAVGVCALAAGAICAQVSFVRQQARGCDPWLAASVTFMLVAAVLCGMGTFSSVRAAVVLSVDDVTPSNATDGRSPSTLLDAFLDEGQQKTTSLTAGKVLFAGVAAVCLVLTLVSILALALAYMTARRPLHRQLTRACGRRDLRIDVSPADSVRPPTMQPVPDLEAAADVVAESAAVDRHKLLLVTNPDGSDALYVRVPAESPPMPAPMLPQILPPSHQTHNDDSDILPSGTHHTPPANDCPTPDTRVVPPMSAASATAIGSVRRPSFTA